MPSAPCIFDDVGAGTAASSGGKIWGETPTCTLWLFNIAIENGPFIDDFPS